MKLRKIAGTSLLIAALLVPNTAALATGLDDVQTPQTDMEDSAAGDAQTQGEQETTTTTTTTETTEDTATEVYYTTPADYVDTDSGDTGTEQDAGKADTTDTVTDAGKADTTDDGVTTESVETTDANPAEDLIMGLSEDDDDDLSALAGGRTITLDGEVSDWSGITTYASNDSNVAKWAVAQNDQYVYFYIQQNGGNQWWLPITQTSMTIAYADGTTNDTSNKIAFAGMLTVKGDFYIDASGAQTAYAQSEESNKYEIEVAIPQSFFHSHDFTLTYCGTSVSSSDITALNTLGEVVEETPVYNGITIDGTFTDWKAVTKTDVNDGSIVQTAVVFDGDYVYIYIKDAGNGCATWAGPKGNGMYELLTDTGRRTTFKLYTYKIDGIDGATVAYSNDQYEIAIPASALKTYRETISFGYCQGDSMVSGIANLQGGNNMTGTSSEIVIDGNYGEWENYDHQLTQYSTNGAYGDDADAALVTDAATSTLYGHVKTYRYATEANPYQPFSVRFNNAESISFRFVTVDENGNINWNPTWGGAGTTTQYYLMETGVATKGIRTETMSYEEAVESGLILGMGYVRMGNDSDTEFEYELDLEAVAAYMTASSYLNSIDVTDMKVISAQYINIGTEWITVAGTSTGPIAGVALSLGVTGCVLAYRKRKDKGIA